MIELFFGPTPNCWKVSIFLEEARIPYRLSPIFLDIGDQFKPEFLAISPNNRIPAIIDHRPADGGEPLALFESGAILLYLAEKHCIFLPTDARGRADTMAWLMWQMGGLGPMLGQHGHFLLYAAERHQYALDRYRAEARRLYGVLDRRLSDTQSYVAGDAFTIADIATFPWVMTHKRQQISLDDYPAVARWFAEVRGRPAVQAGIAAGKSLFANRTPASGASRDRLFGLTATQERPREE
ncbi:MAG: glutathione binding-like protein [Sphingobium sp.]